LPAGGDPSAILGCAQSDSASRIEVTAGFEQRLEFEGRIGIPAPARAP
jgi:hypothetical protein